MNRLQRTWLCLGIGLLITLVTACSSGRGPFLAPKTAPAWRFDSYLSSIAIVVLDYKTLQLQAAYTTVVATCDDVHPPVSEQELRWRASGIFNATSRSWWRRGVKGTEGTQMTLPFTASYIGDFVVLEMGAGDFGGVAVSDPCEGVVLFAGSIVWMGRGRQLYPAEAIPPHLLRRVSEAPDILAPDKLDVWGGASTDARDTRKGIEAWKFVQNLNLVQDFASAPYSVLVYLYPRTVGVFDPDSASWVIFFHRGPTPATPNPYRRPTVTPLPFTPNPHERPTRTPPTFTPQPLSTQQPRPSSFTVSPLPSPQSSLSPLPKPTPKLP